MPRRAKIKVKHLPPPPRERWLVDVPATISASGRRERYYYETEARARTAAKHEQERVESHTKAALGLSDDQKVIAAKAFGMLPPGRSLLDAIELAAARWNADDRGRTVVMVVKELLAARRGENVSSKHLADLRSKLARFEKSFGARALHSIERQEIRGWLDTLQTDEGVPLDPLTRNHYRAALSNIFGYAAAEGYLATNTIVTIRPVKVVKTPVSILSPSEVGRLLRSARSHCYDAKGRPTEKSYILPAVAIGLFAGIRPEEIYELDWSAIHLDEGQIEVAAAIAKTRKHRLVPIQPVLAEWLEPYREFSGRVTPYSYWRTLRKIRHKAKLLTWDDDIIRHCFGSYRLVIRDDAAALALEMGNSQDVIHGHYRRPVSKKAAQEFFTLLPTSDLVK